MGSRYPRTSAASRGYGARWRKARLAFLKRNPLCVYCRQAGRTTPATVVDHIEPHKGDQRKFWDVGNWAALCRPCHDSVKRAEEHGSSGLAPGCDEDGQPLDPRHRWNRTGGGG